MTARPALTNILLIMLLVSMLIMIGLQVWHMIDSAGKGIRMHSVPKAVPTKAPALPDEFLKRFKNPQACNYYVTS